MARTAGYAGGYDYEFVNAPPDRLVCKICHTPCRDAHLTGCCGAHFCRSCLQQVKKGRSVSSACPMCRAERFETFQNKEANREIKALHVYCMNERNGCIWSGEVNDVKRHVDTDCQFVDMPCPSKCGMILKRQCIQSHLAKDCPCYCQYCGFTGLKIEIFTNHKKKCAKYPLPCPNGCELGVVPSGGMATHRKVCPLELVQCNYHDVGCHDRIIRRELVNHYNQKMAEHLNLMKLKLATTMEELTKSEKKLGSMEKELAKSEKKLGSMEKELTKSEKKLVSMGKEIGATKTALNKTRLSYDELTGRVYTAESQLRKLTDEQPVGENRVHNSSTAMHTQYEHDMKLNFITSIFRKHNFCVLVIIFIFLTSYILESNTVNTRLSHIEEQVWLKSLDYLSEFSTSDGNRFTPFIFKMDEITHPLVNFTFFPFNDEFQTSLTMEWDKNLLIFL